MEAVISSSPKAPDPYATSAAQTQSNQQTAAYNAALNRVSTYTPYGSLVYSQTGKDSTGAPEYRADVNLTPQSQEQLTNQQNQDLAISRLGNALTGQINNSLNTPMPDVATDAKAAQDAMYAKQAAYLDPQYQHAQSDLDAKLANQGIMQGSTAYGRSQDDLARQKEFAYGQARDSAIAGALNQEQQAYSLAAARQLQPYNELNALRNGTQIQNPTFNPVPSATAAGTDVSGNINSAYQAKLANSNNFMNGLFSLGAAAIPLASDRRLKRHIRRIGKTPVMGLPLYVYRYIWGGPERVGVMAQDVRARFPHAIIRRPDGFMAVNYGLLS